MICPPVIKREKVVATVMNNYLTSLLTSSQLADILALPSLAVPFARAAKYFPSAKFECERFLSFGIAAERGYKAGCACEACFAALAIGLLITPKQPVNRRHAVHDRRKVSISRSAQYFAVGKRSGRRGTLPP